MGPRPQKPTPTLWSEVRVRRRGHPLTFTRLVLVLLLVLLVFLLLLLLLVLLVFHYLSIFIILFLCEQKWGQEQGCGELTPLSHSTGPRSLGLAQEMHSLM